jgi:hypothetical protein
MTEEKEFITFSPCPKCGGAVVKLDLQLKDPEARLMGGVCTECAHAYAGHVNHDATAQEAAEIWDGQPAFRSYHTGGIVGDGAPCILHGPEFATGKEPPTQSPPTELSKELRKCGVCVHLACEKTAAEDIQCHLYQAADALDRLTAELREAREWIAGHKEAVNSIGNENERLHMEMAQLRTHNSILKLFRGVTPQDIPQKSTMVHYRSCGRIGSSRGQIGFGGCCRFCGSSWIDGLTPPDELQRQIKENSMLSGPELNEGDVGVSQVHTHVGRDNSKRPYHCTMNLSVKAVTVLGRLHREKLLHVILKEIILGGSHSLTKKPMLSGPELMDIGRLQQENASLKKKLDQITKEKLERGKLLERIGAILGIAYPLENRVAIVAHIVALKEKVKDVLQSGEELNKSVLDELQQQVKDRDEQIQELLYDTAALKAELEEYEKGGSGERLVCFGCAHSAADVPYPSGPSGERPCHFCKRNPDWEKMQLRVWYDGSEPLKVPMDCYCGRDMDIQVKEWLTAETKRETKNGQNDKGQALKRFRVGVLGMGVHRFAEWIGHPKPSAILNVEQGRRHDECWKVPTVNDVGPENPVDKT